MRYPLKREATNEGVRGHFAETGLGLVDLWEASPRLLHDNSPKTAEIIEALFPRGSLLCCGWSRSRFNTRPLSNWHKLDELQFLVPSPMVSKWGTTQEGKPSEHSLVNTGTRRFLVVEFDTGTLDEQAAKLLHLGTIAPLALVVYSGGKSLHGWFFAHEQGESNLRRFMDIAVSNGADPCSWSRTQFARMPDGTRDNGKRQTVYFFNPEVIR